MWHDRSCCSLWFCRRHSLFGCLEATFSEGWWRRNVIGYALLQNMWWTETRTDTPWKQYQNITDTCDFIEAVHVCQFARHGRHLHCGCKEATDSETFVLMWFACASVRFSCILESVFSTLFWWRLKLVQNNFWHGFKWRCSSIFSVCFD